MNIHDSLRYREQQLQKEKDAKKANLEKQLKMWTKRRDELRKVGSSAIDPAFIRRSIDKCSNEIDKILKML